MRVIIVGAGGHGRVVADALECRSRLGEPCEIVGFVDDDDHVVGDHPCLAPRILGRIADVGRFEHDAVVVAIGDNRSRAEVFEWLARRGEPLAVVVHPRATVAPDVVLEMGAMVMAGAVINTGARIGANAIVNTGATVDHDNVVGMHVHIAPGVHLGGNVVVCDGAFIGIGSSVIPFRKIGAWSTVGAGAVVIRDVPADATVVGVPATVIKMNNPYIFQPREESFVRGDHSHLLAGK